MRAATFLISVGLCLVSVGGVASIMATDSITTVDGLFMSLILLSLVGVFVLNAFWELRGMGMLSFLHKKKDSTLEQPRTSQRS